MKPKLILPFLPLFCILSCPYPGVPELVKLRFPPLPENWVGVFTNPSWRLEWTDDDGTPRSADIGPEETSVLLGWTAGAVSSLLAHPHWPELSIGPGVFRPAGAIYPVDRSGGRLSLTWIGGVAAWYFRELDRAEGEKRTRPENFNWPRFYALLAGQELPATVTVDPWTVDWRSVAIKTRSSGFDRRRIQSSPVVAVRYIVPVEGPWAPSSPFANRPPWMAGVEIEYGVAEGGTTYVSPFGILRFSPTAQVFFPR